MPIDPHMVWADEQYMENATGIHKYVKQSSLLTEDRLIDLYAGVLNNIYISMGAGPFNHSIQTILARLDKFKTAFLPPNNEQVGYTFITRPKLNLSDTNIRRHPTLDAFDTTDPTSGQSFVKNTAFMMRALLDTKFCEDNLHVVLQSPLIDPRNPFLTPLCNCLTDISGFPDFILETETTEGGYHNEDITYAKGSDMLNKSGELTLGFKDLTGGVNLAIIYLWLFYVALQNKGIVVPYSHHIYQKRMNYTVSIYRFILDPSRTYVIKWAKATGCFPKNAAVGALFNFNEGDSIIQAANQFSASFAYNKVEYSPNNGPIYDFNRLMARYVPGIDTDSYAAVDNELQYNFLGYPYIKSTYDGLKLEFRANTDDRAAYNNTVVDIDALVRSYQTLQEATLKNVLANHPETGVENNSNTADMEDASTDDDLSLTTE